MKVLVLYDSKIQGWLIDEPINNVEMHILNGYPHLSEAWQSGALKAEVIEIPETDTADDYEVNQGILTRK